MTVVIDYQGKRYIVPNTDSLEEAIGKLILNNIVDVDIKVSKVLNY